MSRAARRAHSPLPKKQQPTTQTMVRGHAKAQAQAAAQKKAAGGKGTGKSQLGETREKALRQFMCKKCMIGIASYKALADHYGSKHPKDPVPPEDSFKA